MFRVLLIILPILCAMLLGSWSPVLGEEVHLYSTASKKDTILFDQKDADVISTVFSHDASMAGILYRQGNASYIRVYETASRKVVFQKQLKVVNTSAPGDRLFFSPNNQQIARSVVQEGPVNEGDNHLFFQAFDLKNSGQISKIDNQKPSQVKYILALDYFEESSKYTLNDNKTVIVAEYLTQQPVYEFSIDSGMISFMRLRGRHLLRANWDGKIILRDLVKKKETFFKTNASWAASMDMTSKADRVCVGAMAQIEFWDQKGSAWKKTGRIQLKDKRKYAEVKISSDGKLVLYFTSFAG